MSRPMLRAALLSGLVMVAAFAQVAVAQERMLEIQHALGTTRLEVPPQRVVAFDLGVLDSLERLGVDVVGVPKASLPAYLSRYLDARYTSVGSLTEPDFERIEVLRPDVIFISGRQSSHYAELSRLAPTIYMGIDTADYLASFESNMRLLGRVFGKQEQVEAELGRIRQSIERVRARAHGKTALVVLVTAGRLSAFGPGSRYGFVYDVLGLEPANDDIQVSTHGQPISFEFLLQEDPDYLLVIDRDAVVAGGGAQPARQVIENELVRHTRAYREGQIVYLDPSYWYLSGGGLDSFARMIADVAAVLR
ncbi:siderophore ABC transporter substrate-binding protein [Geochorda subterranea]|uniref:Siderophore ABC transporter substrate-binding protein n=1 Tax=Geochorda subterranea TaxID=3109564 RepID=A0ABZ1BP16_9FIRM|nr:siderophore ABC transporter substrate-binding protein [Limnochorda sp. LNt]WRP14301.1 siderophore ABC transporter substrate-binding protein [Limnochorda sp. LNt]